MINNESVISICLPSKGREARLNQMIQSAVKLASKPELLEFCIYLDQNDEFDPIELLPAHFKIIRGPRLPTSTMTNLAYALSSGEILMYAADDILFRTLNWDDLIRRHFIVFEDGICLVYGNDCSPNASRLATHGFVTRTWTDAVNFLLPTRFESEFCDKWLSDVSKKLHRKLYLPDLIIEHFHPSWGKAEIDQTYEFRAARYNHFYLSFIYVATYFDRKRDVNILKKLKSWPSK